MKLRDREKHTLIKFVLALGSSLLGVMLLSTIMVIAAPTTKPAADAPWGNNVQVNDDATAESAQMAVAVAASKTTSDVYAVWQDPRNGDNDIYFSHSNDAGQTWGAGRRIHHDTGDASQNIPDIALSTGGTLHVTWEDQREDGFNNIYYANSTDDGVTWSTEIRVNDVPTGGQYVPSIAVMTDTVCIAWSDSRNGYQRDIYADCSTDGGVSWGTDTRVSDDGGNSTHAQPDIAIATSGRVHVAWHDRRDDNYNIYYSHSTVGGWSTNTRLNLDTGTANQSNAEIAVNGNTVDVIWVDQRDGIGNAHIYSIRSTTGGDSWQTYNQRVSSLTGAVAPELTTDGSGTPWATWRVYTDMEYILYSDSYGPNGWDTVNETITGSTMTKLEPAIAGGNADVYVAWYGGPYENQDIWLSTRENAVWGDPVQVNDEGDARQHYPTIATGGTDSLYAAWVDYREAQYNDGPVYFARSEDKGATWGYDVRVSDDQHDTSQAPVLGVSEIMTVHAVWESTVYDFQHIYYDRSVDGGVTWRDDKQIDGGGMGYTNATDPDMVISDTETLYVVWVQYPGLYLNYSKDEGITWITPSQILTSTWQIGKPALGIDMLGTLHLAWEEYDQSGAYRIGYTQSGDGGETWTAALYIRETPTATQKSNADLVTTPDHIHIIWQEGPSGEESIYYSASTNGGRNWNAPTTLNRIIPATDPAIARDSSDILYATWLQDDGNHGDIYYTSSIDDGDNWPLPGRVNDDTTNWPQQYPAIAGGNSAYAIWQDFREINWDIYAAALEFEPVCPIPLEGISLEGPQATMVGTPETFAAKISPADATQPVIYTWTPKPAEGQWKPEAVYYWRKPGTYEVQVVVENCGGIYTDTLRVVVSKPEPKLPCIEGKVYYANTPLAGVKVELIAGTSASAAPEQTTTTTRNGSYQFCDVEPGTYMLKRYAPSEEYIGWVASRIKIKSSNLIKNLDLPKKMTLSSPADEALIFTTVPTLTWQPLPEAGRYTLQINKTADWALVEQRSGIATPEYQLSEKLASGQSYTWQVDAYTGTHWIGTTQNAFEFTTAQILTVTLPPIASIYTSLRIEDAPANVTVNKLIGDSTGETHLNYVDIVAYVWTWTSDVRTNVNVVLNVPDNRLGAPVNTWIRSSSGG
ncbi:MAG: exo-alpha-sialidase, partial [Anaerolineae bacterium]|nr:exo-alpha-sialidase [Anaerolineae bacterium]